ncbi:MAG: restriction endonuclease [Anaerolineae bacterium]|nr:restriction endonuclease [Anaerolineae bacterium]
MNNTNAATLSLKEYETTYIAREHIPYNVGERLYRDYGSQVNVEFPSPKTHNRWALTSQGWVGYIPLDERLSLVLKPKVPLHNLFGMLEYAYRLKSFQFLDADLMQCQSLEAFYERLAHILALRVLERGRKGFYRAYLDRADQLPYVSGRVDMRYLMQHPCDPHLRCHYEDHTADIADNQILAWTLRHILHSGICTEYTLPAIRQAYRALQGLATLHPYTPQDCVARLYHRLNADYHPMHALCRFFLEHSGPSHKVGEHTFIPFLVNMARLYELFVAEWLTRNLDPARFQLKAQDTVTIGEHQNLRFNIDLTLYDTKTQSPICVLDTKYKAPDVPSQSDLSQVVMYAELKQCQDACLIYPTDLQVLPLKTPVGQIRIHTLTFSVAGNLEEGGHTFLRSLKEILNTEPHHNGSL